MTGKELSELYYLRREINADTRRLREMEKDSAMCTKQKAELKAKIERMTATKERLENYIAEIPDSLTRQIFTFRFIKGMPWRQIAYTVGGRNTADSVRKVCSRYIRKHQK